MGSATRKVAIGLFVTAAVLVAAVSLLMPTLCRSSEAANRIKCSSNLREIGLAIKIYAEENGGMYPANLGALLRTQDITVDVFICPSSNDDRVDNPKTMPVSMLADMLRPGTRCCSYFYCGSSEWNEKTLKEECIVAYEPVANHDGDGFNILFGDGHVDWVAMRNPQQMIAELNAGQNPPPSLR